MENVTPVEGQDGVDDSQNQIDDGQIIDEDQTTEPQSQGNDDVAQYRMQLEEANRRAEFYRQMALDRQQPQEPEPEYDEYPVSGDDFSRIVDKKIQPLKENMHRNVIMQQEELMRQRYKDYDEVVNNYSRELFQQNPGLYDAIITQSNAPQLAYNLGVSHPAYQAKLNKQAKEAAAQKISGNLSKPSSLSRAGGSAPKGGVDFSKMTQEEFNKYVNDVKMGRG